MDFCYHCFRELETPRSGTGGRCPACGTPFTYLNSFDCLMCGSVLAGRFIVGQSRGTRFAQSYIGFDWKTKRRVTILEFFPYKHAQREVGLPQVIYHNGGLVISGSPESEPSFWLDKFHDLEILLTDLCQGSGQEHFPKMMASFQENNTAYMVTEWVEGEDLESYLNKQGGTVPWLEAMRLLAPVSKALTKVSQNDAIHGALSPEKIVIAQDGTVKILDTGVYSTCDYYDFATVDDAWPTHWSPYHFFSVLGKKPALDVYSLASCFYRAVAGIAPDAPNTYKNVESLPLPEEQKGCIPFAMEQVLLEALRFSPEKYPTAAEFWQAIEASARQE